jgi:hypothetical protein
MKNPLEQLSRVHQSRAFGPQFDRVLVETGQFGRVAHSSSLQKVPKCDWHGPRSHINHVLPIKTADQVPAEVVQIGIEDDGNPRPLFVVAKNLTVANYGDILAGLRIDNIAVEHVFLFCVSDVTLQLRIRRVVPVAVLLSADASERRAYPLSDVRS